MKTKISSVEYRLFVVLLFLSLSTLHCSSAAQPTVGPAATESTQPTVQTSDEAGNEATGTNPKNLTVLHHSFPPVMDPVKDVNGVFDVFNTMFDGLTRFDEQTLEVMPALAESWELIDETTWEFKLREGVTFHNGEPFNAEAVKFTVERMVDPEVNAGQRGRASAVIGAEVVDEYTVRILTEFPDPTVPRGLIWWFIIPPEYFNEVGEEGFAAHPVGTGPFEFVEWSPDESITVKAFDNYWRGRPKIDTVTFKNVPEGATRVAALQSGEADIAPAIPLDLLNQLEAAEGIRIESTPFASGLIIQFDLTEPTEPLQDKRVRQALNYAVDKESINESLLLGLGAVLDGQIATKEAFGYCDRVEAYPYDPEMAKQLLAEAGYADGFNLTIHTPSGKYAQDDEIVTTVAEQLRAVGVNVSIDQSDVGRWENILANQVEGPREAILVGWFNYGEAQLALRHSTSESPFALWANEEFDARLDAAKATFDAEERQELSCEAVEYMREEAAAIFLVQPPILQGVAERVQGYHARPDEQMYLYPVDIAG